jgi:hypothetical protein
MGTKSVRLDSFVSFDETQEADIIESLEYLKSSHKMVKFLANLVRIAYDNPELIQKDLSSGKYNTDSLCNMYNEYGMSVERYHSINEMKKNVNAMKEKVEKMYDMTLKTYTLAQMNKYVGIEIKSENQLMAQYVLEKQIKDIEETLGVTGSVLASNKKQDAKKLADETLEYIIESYSGVVEELKKMVTEQQSLLQQTQQLVNQQQMFMNQQQQMIMQQMQPVQQVIMQPVVQQPVQQVQQVAQAVPTVTEKVEKPVVGTVKQDDKNKQAEAVKEDTSTTTSDNSDDEYLDFGDADLDALSNFFGD